MAFIKNDKAYEELRKTIGKLADARVRVGVLEGGDDEVETEHGELTIVELATIHEYGAPEANIPERSFLRKTFTDDRGRAETAEFQAEQVRQVMEAAPRRRRAEALAALKRMGAWGASKVRERIREHIDPPLKPATIKRKGSSTPLVDTGALINSVSWDIVEPEGGGK